MTESVTPDDITALLNEIDDFIAELKGSIEGQSDRRGVQIAYAVALLAKGIAMYVDQNTVE